MVGGIEAEHAKQLQIFGSLGSASPELRPFVGEKRTPLRLESPNSAVFQGGPQQMRETLAVRGTQS